MQLVCLYFVIRIVPLNNIWIILYNPSITNTLSETPYFLRGSPESFALALDFLPHIINPFPIIISIMGVWELRNEKSSCLKYSGHWKASLVCGKDFFLLVVVLFIYLFTYLFIFNLTRSSYQPSTRAALGNIGPRSWQHGPRVGDLYKNDRRPIFPIIMWQTLS